MAQANLDQAETPEDKELTQAVVAALLPSVPEERDFVSAIVAGVGNLPPPRR